MAIITRGKHKGKDVKISQFCNDWISIKDERIPAADTIFSPTSFVFSDEEKHRINLARDAGNTGFMFGYLEWNGNRLKRKRRK